FARRPGWQGSSARAIPRGLAWRRSRGGRIEGRRASVQDRRGGEVGAAATVRGQVTVLQPELPDEAVGRGPGDAQEAAVDAAEVVRGADGDEIRRVVGASV